jgi:hypothetical protein
VTKVCKDAWRDWKNAVEQQQRDFCAGQQTGKQHQAGALRTAQTACQLATVFI